MRSLLASLVVLLTIVPSLLVSETTEYGSYRHFSEVPNALFLVGDIENGDSFELRRAMRDNEISLVVAASPGGSLYEGLQMASIIHDKGIGTYVPEIAHCESSCANVFFGGTKRMALGEIGVHQFYSSSETASDSSRKDITTATTQYTTSDILGILNDFKTPPFVYEKMFGTIDVYYFKAVEKQRLGLEVGNKEFVAGIEKVDAFLVSSPEVVVRRNEVTSTVLSGKEEVTTSPFKPPAQLNPSTSSRFSDTDFFGMDLNPQGIRNVSLHQCASYCENNPACAAWSYVHETRWCWPKSGVTNLSWAENVTSGVTDPSRINPSIFNRSFIEATGIDLRGYDLQSTGIRDVTLEQCRNICLNYTSCIAWSYLPKKSWCFPKYGVGQHVSQIGVISGVLRQDE